MTLLEQELLDNINESYELLGLDDRYTDIALSETVTQADIKKYNDIFKQANKLIKDNGGKAQFQNILNVLLLMLQYCLSFIGKIGINAATAGLPINQKTMIKSSDGKVIIGINIPAVLLGFVFDQLLALLFNKGLNSVKTNSLKNSYKKLINELERIKRVCKDDKLEQKCQTYIDKINKAIKDIDKKSPIKEDNNMRTLSEMLEEIENESTFEDIDSILNFLDEACAKDECSTSKREGCTKKEDTDMEDEIDDEDLEESYSDEELQEMLLSLDESCEVIQEFVDDQEFQIATEGTVANYVKAGEDFFKLRSAFGKSIKMAKKAAKKGDTAEAKKYIQAAKGTLKKFEKMINDLDDKGLKNNIIGSISGSIVMMLRYIIPGTAAGTTITRSLLAAKKPAAALVATTLFGLGFGIKTIVDSFRNFKTVILDIKKEGLTARTFNAFRTQSITVLRQMTKALDKAEKNLSKKSVKESYEYEDLDESVLFDADDLSLDF